ncbi:MAG: ATPase [Oscillatoriales cyanobacterium]|uniref:NB-ARC domain-containing protein n=1 Tax=Microcoleus sp. PH2017_05_CCC_O_A TaxID=2798816 RepID=UPI001DC7E18A|nr:NB-ARC domain-containing protein [Microcoleus sp. PH2017_05_CCC_O_A]TAF98991.1 MAG: ATPase [Oscillatoriales cyanobacterium]MCC3436279.1 ATPase [Microcoleus sp. PH2017_05_CCC_O_A]TAG14665.1 MAG: ATPase [Oscillatoriales cyanobacterium]TAG47539.1 MAG: ATPase [Oscillatoriales cyanobacterium]TAG53549.1 MAG: ATPase [Oscillatoriales cyanobacterium]
MDAQEILNFADDLVFANTGKHLEPLQQSILRSAWQGQKYSKTADEFHCTEGHVKDVASELWQLFSKILGEEVNKANFRVRLEQVKFSNLWNFNNKDCVHIGNVNVCENSSQPPKAPSSPIHEEPLNKNNTEPKVRQFLAEMPKSGIFYDRTTSLATLKQWILHENTRLLAIHGIVGIGKTAIAAQLVEQIKHEFDFVIWRSLATSPPLSILQKNIIQFFRRGGAPVPAPAPVPANSSPEEGATTGGLPLLEYLQKYRCLLILDDVQMVNSSGQLAGNYQPGYEDYGTLFRQVAELSHNSCLVLLSWEKPREIAALEGKNQPVRSLQLNGLGAGAAEILREKGLAEDAKWSEIIEQYRGNPLWLKIVATMIQDLFNGSLSEFLSDDPVFLGDLESLLHQPFNRLSESEKQVMSWLASETAPVSLSKLPENMQLSRSQFLKVMQSLGRRSLIEKIPEGDRTFFTLGPVLKEYVKTNYSRPNIEQEARSPL